MFDTVENLEETEQYKNYLDRFQKTHQLAKELRGKDWTNPDVLKKVRENLEVFELLHAEGYWRYDKDNILGYYPWPVENKFKKEDLEIFLPKLALVEDRISTKVLPGSNFFRYMGYSRCRCCDQPNGTSEYAYNGWKWPTGYRHYLEVHGVEPTASFVFFINEAYEKAKNLKAKKEKKSRQQYL